jgi:integrase
VTIYKRGKVWHYDFICHGRRYRGSTEETNEKRAQRIEDDRKMEARTGSSNSCLPPRQQMTLREVAPRFQKWLETARSEKRGQPLDADTKRYYNTGWRLLQDLEIVQMPMGSITKDDISALRFPAGPYNANCALRTLRRMLRKAHDWNLTGSPPTVLLFEEVGRERIFSPKQESEFLAAAPQPLRDVWLCGRDAGMRPEEVLRMRVEDVNWDRRLIFIPRGKTANSRRYVPMSRRLMEALWLRTGDREEGWVFPSRIKKNGQPFSKSGHLSYFVTAHQFIDVRDKIGLGADYVLYSARHTFGTYLYAKTRNLALVMALMGHGDVKTAMRYQHPEFELAIDAIDEMAVEMAWLEHGTAPVPQKANKHTN